MGLLVPAMLPTQLLLPAGAVSSSLLLLLLVVGAIFSSPLLSCR